MRNILFLMLFFCATTCVAATPAAELQELLSKVHTMSANFTQTAQASAKKASAIHSAIGSMIFERPNKFRWETKEPNQQLIIAKEKTIWFYDVDLEQVTKRKVNYREPGNPAILLSGNPDTLQELFKIKKLEQNLPGVWFKLTPKQQNNMYQAIKINFVDGAIKAMVIVDNLGGQSNIQFTNIEINTAINPKLFKFTVPHGVDVVTE